MNVQHLVWELYDTVYVLTVEQVSDNTSICTSKLGTIHRHSSPKLTAITALVEEFSMFIKVQISENRESQIVCNIHVNNIKKLQSKYHKGQCIMITEQQVCLIQRLIHK